MPLQSINFGYFCLLAMGVLGIVLVTLASTFIDLASNTGNVSTDCGSVFISRGFGALIGSLASTTIYHYINGKYVIIFTFIVTIIVFGLLPFNKSYELLVFYYFLMGIVTSIADFGCGKLTRLVYNKKSGPWLGIYNITFGIFGSVVPLLSIITKQDLHKQYYALIALIVLSTFLFLFSPNAQQEATSRFGILSRTSRTVNNVVVSSSGLVVGSIRQLIAPHYHVEMVVSVILFFVIGGINSATTFIAQYVDSAEIISYEKEPQIIFVFWIMVTVGRLLGVLDQIFISTTTIPYHMGIALFVGIIGMIIAISAQYSGEALWVGMVVYGIGSGPIVGFCSDLISRVTYSSSVSYGMIMFGYNLGLAIVPYVTTLFWSRLYGEKCLLVIILLTMALPMMILPSIQYLSYAYQETSSEARGSIYADEDGSNVFWNELSKSKDVALNTSAEVYNKIAIYTSPKKVTTPIVTPNTV